MFFKLMVFFSIMTSLMVGLISSPFILCLLVLLMTGSSCGIVSMMCPQWLSYALVIVFLGGMMVLFTYASSMSVSDKLTKKGSMSMGFIVILTLLMFSMKGKMNMMMSSIYMGMGVLVLLLTTMYLLVCLFSVVKMVEVSEGALIS